MERFGDNENGTVTDRKTGNVWVKDPFKIGAKTWNEASEAVASLSHGWCGLNDGSNPGDWRLPTKDDLEGLLEVCKTTDFFLQKGGDFQMSTLYWTATPLSGSALKYCVWAVDFCRGYVSAYGKDAYCHVLPVKVASGT